MIRRILIVAGIGLALVLGARLALAELTERAWEKRRAELLELALFPPDVRRPWEVKFEALQERSKTSEWFEEIVNSPHRPDVACGWDEPRPLNDFEKVWVDALWTKLQGIEAVLDDLRGLPLEAVEWHGETVKLLFLREVVNALCARAWLEVEGGNDIEAARDYADALRLSAATDTETSIGTMIRFACQGVTLRSARSALELGLSSRELRSALAPILESWATDPDRCERSVRRELSFLAQAIDQEEPFDDPAFLLDYCEPVETALALARQPVANTPWARGESLRDDDEPGFSRLEGWTMGVRQLHALHAQRNVVLTALAVAAYREEHGAWPTTLSAIEDLPADHTLDTLTLAPLPYSVDEHGARIGPASWGERVDRWQGEGESPYVWTLR